MNLLMIIAMLLGLLVVIRLMTVAQLASVLSGEDEDEEQKRHNSMNGIGMMIFMVVGLVLMGYMTIKYQPFMLPESASAHGARNRFSIEYKFFSNRYCVRDYSNYVVLVCLQIPAQ